MAAFRNDCDDQACLKAVTLSYPSEVKWTIAVAWKRVWVGAALFLLGVGIRLRFDVPYSLTLCTALGAAGLFVMLSGVRWTGR